MRILVADIGGTHSRLQLLELDNLTRHVIRQAVYDNIDYSSPEEVLKKFLSETGNTTIPEAACLAVAGPVIRQQARLTNLPWHLDGARLADHLRMRQVLLINDLEAAAYGINQLPDEDLSTLQAGEALAGSPALVIGIGTGYGQATFIQQQGSVQVFASEAGHTAFAPTTAPALKLLQDLLQERPWVSVETILSGPGLERIHRSLHGVQGGSREHPLTAAEITRLAQTGDAMAGKSVSLFMQLLGSQAANAALSCLTIAGIYLTGGVIVALAEQLQDSSFIDSFRLNPAMATLLSSIPIRVVNNPHLGLQGAASFLQRQLHTHSLRDS